MKAYYQNITSQESLKLEKMRLKNEILRSSSQFSKKAKFAVLPKNQSLMQSDITFVRYAAWIITAYKTYRSVKNMFRKKK